MSKERAETTVKCDETASFHVLNACFCRVNPQIPVMLQIFHKNQKCFYTKHSNTHQKKEKKGSEPEVEINYKEKAKNSK